jgi:RNA polymerase sigma-70 factor (ECF subfamily)
VKEQTCDDRELVRALRLGDEEAFAELVGRYHGHLLPLASVYVANRAVAEEVVQETWLAVLEGIDRFEERSSLKTWLSRIVMNRARTKGVRENRMVPFTSWAETETGSFEPAVDSGRFRSSKDPYPGHWSVGPESWGADPESALLGSEMRDVIDRAIAGLPKAQGLVITMRDVNGWTAEEVCNTLDISETNERVLLHRARSRVRNAVEDYFKTRRNTA